MGESINLLSCCISLLNLLPSCISFLNLLPSCIFSSLFCPTSYPVAFSLLSSAQPRASPPQGMGILYNWTLSSQSRPPLLPARLKRTEKSIVIMEPIFSIFATCLLKMVILGHPLMPSRLKSAEKSRVMILKD